MSADLVTSVPECRWSTAMCLWEGWWQSPDLGESPPLSLCAVRANLRLCSHPGSTLTLIPLRRSGLLSLSTWFITPVERPGMVLLSPSPWQCQFFIKALHDSHLKGHSRIFFKPGPCINTFWCVNYSLWAKVFGIGPVDRLNYEGQSYV